VNRNRKPRHTTLVGAFTFFYPNLKPIRLFFTFYPNIYELGVDGAFEKAFGITMEELYVEFEEFLSLPADQQMGIIPNP